jgi:hypothetical protein
MPRKTDPQIVKDALQAKDIDLLQRAIADFRSEVKEGFAGVHARQDTTNGKVLKAGEEIIQLKADNIKRDAKFQYNRIIWYLFTVAIGLIVSLGTYLLTNH